MAYKIPRYSELTNDQRLIINLPHEKNYLVTGAPGTGKTVVAIHRAKDMCDNGKRILILVYNRPLMSYISSTVSQVTPSVKVNTWQSWISGFYRENFGCGYPQVDGAYTYNWAEIRSDFGTLGKVYDHILIDEAQDVPLELIQALLIVSKGVSCFMDVNQSLVNPDANYQDVADVLHVRTAYKLHDNFRNTKEIFDFAKLYHQEEDAETIKGSLRKKPIMTKCSTYGHSTTTQLTSQMVKKLRNSNKPFTGIFVPYQRLRKTYEELVECLPDRNVYLYKSRSEEFGDIDFSDEKGIYVMSYSCMKGLEFETVLLPQCEAINSDGEPKLDRNKLYTAITRASEELYCFYFRQTSSPAYIDFFGPIKGHENLLILEK